MLTKQAFLKMSAHTLIPDVFIAFNLVFTPLKKLNNCDLEGLEIWGTTKTTESISDRDWHISSAQQLQMLSNLKKVSLKKKSQHWFNPSETTWWHFSYLDPFFQDQHIWIHTFHFTIRYKQGLPCNGCKYFIIESYQQVLWKSFFQN